MRYAGIILNRVLVVLLGTIVATAARPATIDAYYYFIHWTSVGRLDRALDQFNDDAVVIVGAACPEEDPCIGKTAIAARYLPLLRAGQLPLPLFDQRFDGTRLCTRGETMVLVQPSGARLALRGGHCFEFRADRIAALRFDFDLSDPLTAAWMMAAR